MYALNAATGQPIWQRTIGQYGGSSPTLIGNIVYVGSGSSSLNALDAASGSPLWNYRTNPAGVYSTPIINAGMLYFTNRANLWALSVDGKTVRWKIASTGADDLALGAEPMS